jgi:hypothetical protein
MGRYCLPRASAGFYGLEPNIDMQTLPEIFRKRFLFSIYQNLLDIPKCETNHKKVRKFKIE